MLKKQRSDVNKTDPSGNPLTWWDGLQPLPFSPSVTHVYLYY